MGLCLASFSEGLVHISLLFAPLVGPHPLPEQWVWSTVAQRWDMCTNPLVKAVPSTVQGLSAANTASTHGLGMTILPNKFLSIVTDRGRLQVLANLIRHCHPCHSTIWKDNAVSLNLVEQGGSTNLRRVNQHSQNTGADVQYLVQAVWFGL